MEGYREDEAASLRRANEDLVLKVDQIEQELTHAKKTAKEADGRIRNAQAETKAAQAELVRIKTGGVPHERLILVVHGGVNAEIYTAGFACVAIVVVFAFAALFSSCRGCNGVAEAADNATGVITDRYHYEERTYTTCSGSGRSRTCTTHVIPEHWTVRVAHDAHEREVRLNHEDWELTQIGAPWCERPPCEPILVTEER
jgi:hypothetical protein